MGVADVAAEYLKLSFHIHPTTVEPAPTIERVVEHEGAHVVTLSDQGFGEVGANEAVGTGDKDFLSPHCSIHLIKGLSKAH
ncbi:unannotated protein [freshwater metagenome]|uniref:Unannotated protein n=1 Tax=freshwater metagenome TaxID=449393 RepID=A0A6J7W8J0_9ZZZZ